MLLRAFVSWENTPVIFILLQLIERLWLCILNA